jgi:hypothetical protein
MKVIARRLVGVPDPNAPMSSPGIVLEELEVAASCRDEAIAACAVLGVVYVMPVVCPSGLPRAALLEPAGDPAPVRDPENPAIAQAGERALREIRIAKAVMACRAAHNWRKTQTPKRPRRRPANAKTPLIPGQGYAKVPK